MGQFKDVRMCLYNTQFMNRHCQKAEIVKLKEFRGKFDVKITEDAIKSAINLKNREQRN